MGQQLSRLGRREFVASAAAASAGWWVLRDSRSAWSSNANEKLNLAIIGADGMGAANLAAVAGENIVALCDVNEQRAASAFGRYPGAKRYHDLSQVARRAGTPR